VVVGAGYIAVELAGILNALGSDVSLLIRYDKVGCLCTFGLKTFSICIICVTCSVCTVLEVLSSINRLKCATITQTESLSCDYYTYV